MRTTSSRCSQARHERLVDEVADDELRRVKAARGLAPARAGAHVDAAGRHLSGRAPLSRGHEGVELRVVAQGLARAVELELEQPLVDVAEAADVEVGVVDAPGLVVVGVDGEAKEGRAQTGVRGAHGGQEPSGCAVGVVVEQAAVVGGHSPFDLAVGDGVEGLLEVAPDVGCVRVEGEALLLGGDHPLDALLERVRAVALARVEREVVARLGVEDEEQAVEERERRVVDGGEPGAVGQLDAGALCGLGERGGEARHDALVDAPAEAIAELGPVLGRSFADAGGERIGAAERGGREERGEVGRLRQLARVDLNEARGAARVLGVVEAPDLAGGEDAPARSGRVDLGEQRRDGKLAALPRAVEVLPLGVGDDRRRRAALGAQEEDPRGLLLGGEAERFEAGGGAPSPRGRPALLGELRPLGKARHPSAKEVGGEESLVADAREPARTLGAPERLGQALANLERVERGRSGEIVDDETGVEGGDRRRGGARPDDGGALGCRDDEDERDGAAVEALLEGRAGLGVARRALGGGQDDFEVGRKRPVGRGGDGGREGRARGSLSRSGEGSCEEAFERLHRARAVAICLPCVREAHRGLNLPPGGREDQPFATSTSRRMHRPKLSERPAACSGRQLVLTNSISRDEYAGPTARPLRGRGNISSRTARRRDLPASVTSSRLAS